jgi:hypothetical protein
VLDSFQWRYLIPSHTDNPKPTAAKTTARIDGESVMPNKTTPSGAGSFENSSYATVLIPPFFSGHWLLVVGHGLSVISDRSKDQ